MGVPDQNLFYGCSRTKLIPTEQPRIGQTLLSAQRSARALQDSAAELASALKLALPATIPDAEVVCRVAKRVVQEPRLEGVRLHLDDWLARQDDLRALVTAGERYSELRARYDEVLIPEAWDQDLLETRQHLATYGRRWWKFMSGNYRRARDQLNGLYREPLPEDLDQQLAIIDAVLEARRPKNLSPRCQVVGLLSLPIFHAPPI